MKYQEVTIISSPVTTRYVKPGTTGQINHKTNRIRIRGPWTWFDFDPKKWKVITNEEKEIQ